MRLQFDPLRKLVAQKIHAAMLSAYDGTQLNPALSDPENIYDSLVEPPDKKMGHLAFATFNLAKSLRNGPPKIAQQLSEKMSTCKLTSTTAIGPYLNFMFNGDALGRYVIEPIHSGAIFKGPFTAHAPKTMIEFSQPNTHKELHVGHMRNLCLGDSIVRLLKYSGYEIISSTFPGDMGTHVAKCLWYLKNHNQEPCPTENSRTSSAENTKKKPGEWLGRMYSLAHIKLEDEENTPNGAKNKAMLTQIIKQLEDKKGEFYDLWVETRQWSIELMQSVYEWADVKFDHWYWESEVDAASVALVQRYYKEGKLILSEGAVGMDLSSDNLGFCLLLKSDGTGLYATKDLELARKKFEDFGVEKSIYVVDMRQALHFKQVFKTLERLGFEQAKQCLHLQYNYVELPDGAMSSRKGNIVPLTELIHRMEEMVKSQYLSRYKDEWSVAEIQSVAQIVAKGAIKYGMIRQDSNKKIVFDMNEWLKLDGESGPFIQYSYARIASLIRKLGFDTNSNIKTETASEITWSELKHPTELFLAGHLAQFNMTVVTAAENYKPASVCNYLYDLSRSFNAFYHECPISTAENENLKQARLSLAAATGTILKSGLALLGIPVPERM